MRQARRAFRRIRALHLNTDVSFREWARSKRPQTAVSPKLERIVRP